MVVTTSGGPWEGQELFAMICKRCGDCALRIVFDEVRELHANDGSIVRDEKTLGAVKASEGA